MLGRISIGVLSFALVFFVGPRVYRHLNQHTPPPPLAHGDTLALPPGVVVVNAWASWCRACQDEATTYADFERSHPGVPVVGIDDDQDPEVGAWAAERWGWHHRNVWDPHGTLLQQLGSAGLPTTWVLDDRHRVVATQTGAVDAAWLEQALAATGT